MIENVANVTLRLEDPTISVLQSDLLDLHCQELQQQQQYKFKVENYGNNTNGLFCPILYDSVVCWPPTEAGTWAIIPCFAEFKGIQYDSTQNATRYCNANGTWDNYSNYDNCQVIGQLEPLVVNEFSTDIELTSYIYCIGYIISLVFLIAALTVLLSFKNLKCLRNTIHSNLFLTYILSALLWLLLLYLQVMTNESNQIGCIILVMIFQYFNITNFFWMFVEGLYLYILVIETFSIYKLHFFHYALFGWGFPAIIVLIWSLAKLYESHTENPQHFNSLAIECSWIRESSVDWIYQAPTAIVLLINLIFLIRIISVLIRKLHSVNTLEIRQYFKAAKALVVLIPLLGITYLLVIVGPEHGIKRNLFEIVRAVLISTQGLFVALLFCFLNSEVRQTLRHRIARWREHRHLYTQDIDRKCRYHVSKDLSQKSNTESICISA